MDTSRRIATALTFCLAFLLGIGTVSGSHHQSHAPPEQQAMAMAALTAPVSSSAAAAVRTPNVVRSAPGAAPAGGMGIPAGFPHHAHRDERLIEEEHELALAAPHTLWRFDSGRL
ncbi:MAG: hypothetical protein M3021_10130 [Actinomycetota bacterium]|nr:hypothetical protein [Actinomycetota bacterium]